MGAECTGGVCADRFTSAPGAGSIRPMSKAKKAATNAKRARRLGTGEGIAPTRGGRGGGGGTPLPWWVWMGAGALIVAVVAVAFVLIERGSNPAKGQNSAVVQQRLSHSRLDPLSQPTWPPNYANLSAALTALSLTPSQEMAAINHYHVHLTLFVNGHQVQIPELIGLDNQTGVVSEIHTHLRTVDNGQHGIIHIESGVLSFRATLLQFFDIWGVYFSDRCIGGYCGGVRLWVNGTPFAHPTRLVLQRHMALTLVEGPEPPHFVPVKSWTFPPGE